MMDTKFLIVFISLVGYAACGAALRRTPKVYNALITTDDNLTPSRAYPVIQPTIHETGIATYPFGTYNPYRFYNPQVIHQIGHPIQSNFLPREPYPFGHPQLQQIPTRNLPPPPPSGPAEIPREQNEITPPGPPLGVPPSGPSPPLDAAVPPSGPPSGLPSGPAVPPSGPPSGPGVPAEANPSQVQVPVMPNERQPIPLNQFGLPPSLIPLQSYQPHPQYPHHPQHTINLSPYPFQSFPVTYENFNGYREHYLPPYEHFPSHTFGIRAPPRRYPGLKPAFDVPQPQPQPTAAIAPTPAAPAPRETEKPQQPQPEQAPVVSLDAIKNGIENKNSAVPDVPPPPIPSGAKNVAPAA